MSDALENLLNAIRKPKTTEEQAVERLCCPDCGTDAPRADILNNASRCPACGALMDVDSKPRAFT